MSALLKAHDASARFPEDCQSQLARQFDLVATAPDGVTKLRELILTLAVQGRLVAQNPNDKPAREHLAHVRSAIGERLADWGRAARQPELNPVAEDEARFSLPSGWAWCRLGEVAVPQAGFAFKSSGFNEHKKGMPLIRIRDVGSGSAPSTYYAGEFRDEFIVKAGEWLISMDGEFRVRPWQGPTALLNQRVTRLIFFSQATNRQFVSVALQRELRALQGVKAYTTVDHLSGKQIAEAVIALPPEAEQARIVARVNELMCLCDALESSGQLEAMQHSRLLATVLEKLTDSRSPEELDANWQRAAKHFDLVIDRAGAVDMVEASITDLALQGRLVHPALNGESGDDALKAMATQVSEYRQAHRIPPSRIEPILRSGLPYELPRNWRWVRLDSMCKVITDGDHLPPPKSDTGVAFLTIGNISSGKIVFGNCRYVPQEYFARIAPYRRPVKGDLLYTVVGATYGRPVAVESDRPFCVQRHIAILKPATAGVDVEFLRLVMTSSFAYRQATSEVTGTAQPTIPLGALRNYLVPLPPLAEQRRIVARVNELRGLCAELRERLSSARALQARLADALGQKAVERQV